MSDLERRIVRLEARRSIEPEKLAAQARVEKMMPELIAFIDAAIPDRRESPAHYVMQILGLPDSRAMRAHLQGRSLETIARDTYGENWRAEMEATTAKAAVHFEAAHGPDWWNTFAAIWFGGENGE